jgi:hypothetical protein
MGTWRPGGGCRTGNPGLRPDGGSPCGGPPSGVRPGQDAAGAARGRRIAVRRDGCRKIAAGDTFDRARAACTMGSEPYPQHTRNGVVQCS